MEHDYNSRVGFIWFESFERRRQIQIRNLINAINEALKEDINIRDSQQEDSNNQISDYNNPPSKEISSQASSLDFPSTSNVFSGKAVYGCSNNGSPCMADQRKYEQSLQNGHSSGISESTFKHLNLKSEFMLYTGQQEQTETEEPFGNEFEKSLLKIHKDCMDSPNLDNEYFIQPLTPNNFKNAFLRADNDPYTLEIENKIRDNCSPAYKLIKFFVPPKMPTELLTALSQPRSLDAARTEKTLYYAQIDLYLSAKPLIESLFDISKFKFNKLSEVQSLISNGLQGILSSSLNISQARRENVCPLIKNEAVDVFKKSLPTIKSLFGCDDIDLKKLRKINHKKIRKTMNRKYKKC